jgi:hypothetical protein
MSSNEMTQRKYGNPLKRSRSNPHHSPTQPQPPSSHSQQQHASAPSSFDFEDMPTSLTTPTKSTSGYGKKQTAAPRPSSNAPTRSPSITTSSSTTSSSAAPHRFETDSFSGTNREQLDELQYLLDGLKLSEPSHIRHLCAYKLTELIQQPGVCFLMRANGGFHACGQVLEQCQHDPVTTQLETKLGMHNVFCVVVY